MNFQMLSWMWTVLCESMQLTLGRGRERWPREISWLHTAHNERGGRERGSKRQKSAAERAHGKKKRKEEIWKSKRREEEGKTHTAESFQWKSFLFSREKSAHVTFTMEIENFTLAMNEEEGKSYFFGEFRMILVCVNFCILVMISAFAHFRIEIFNSSSDQITHNNVQIRAAGIWGSALNHSKWDQHNCCNWVLCNLHGPQIDNNLHCFSSTLSHSFVVSNGISPIFGIISLQFLVEPAIWCKSSLWACRLLVINIIRISAQHNIVMMIFSDFPLRSLAISAAAVHLKENFSFSSYIIAQIHTYTHAERQRAQRVQVVASSSFPQISHRYVCTHATPTSGRFASMLSQELRTEERLGQDWGGCTKQHWIIFQFFTMNFTKSSHNSLHIITLRESQLWHASSSSSISLGAGGGEGEEAQHRAKKERKSYELVTGGGATMREAENGSSRRGEGREKKRREKEWKWKWRPYLSSSLRCCV